MVEWIECKISDIGTVVGGATPLREVLENYGLLPINSYH
jgi:type I restriction enzyme, S subunit